MSTLDAYKIEFNDNIQPREGFEYPAVGDQIVALQDHETSATDYKDKWLRKDDVGRVIGLRKPGSYEQESGYIGLIVQFDRVSKSYPCGFVLRWDWASDPAKFAYRKPAP